jgi:hypothetical protein
MTEQRNNEPGFHAARAEAIYGPPPEHGDRRERSAADEMALTELAGVVAQYFRFGDSEAAERLDVFLHTHDTGLRAADVLDNLEAAIIAAVMLNPQREDWS